MTGETSDGAVTRPPRPPSSPVRLVEIDRSHRAVLDHLGQLFRHDLSESLGHLPNRDGSFNFRPLDRFRAGVDPSARAWLIEVAGRVGGFVLVHSASHDEGGLSLAAFFVVRALRRTGVGRVAARELLAHYPGRWEIGFQPYNPGVDAFWTAVAAEAVGSAWTRSTREVPVERVPADVFITFDNGTQAPSVTVPKRLTGPATPTSAVRPAVADDVPAIQELGIANGMLTVEEAAEFAALLDGAIDDPAAGMTALVVHSAGEPLSAAAFYGPEAFADRVWNLFFIAVRPSGHRRGVGRMLLEAVERDLRSRGPEVARVLVVETSSTETYVGARRFYADAGFDEEARIRDFYGPGDDKIVFWKSLETG